MIVKLVFLEETEDIGIYSISVKDENGCFKTHEYLDFVNRMKLASKKNGQLVEIKRFIEKMKSESDIFGYVKREEQFARFPPDWFRFFDSDGKKDWGLRLYCVPVDEKNIILLNGDLKTAKSALKCDNCRDHFLLGRKIANAFFTDWRIKGEITVEDNCIYPTNEDINDIFLTLPNE